MLDGKLHCARAFMSTAMLLVSLPSLLAPSAPLNAPARLVVLPSGLFLSVALAQPAALTVPSIFRCRANSLFCTGRTTTRVRRRSLLVVGIVCRLSFWLLAAMTAAAYVLHELAVAPPTPPPRFVLSR